MGTDPNSHRELFSVSVNADGTPGRPERLFDAVDLGFRLTYRGSRGYDIGTDGERIIVQAIGLEGTPTISIMDTHAWLARALSR